MIREHFGNDKERCKQEILQEIQRTLLTYEERIASLEKQVKQFADLIEELNDNMEALDSDVRNKLREITQLG